MAYVDKDFTEAEQINSYFLQTLSKVLQCYSLLT